MVEAYKNNLRSVASLSVFLFWFIQKGDPNLELHRHRKQRHTYNETAQLPGFWTWRQRKAPPGTAAPCHNMSDGHHSWLGSGLEREVLGSSAKWGKDVKNMWERPAGPCVCVTTQVSDYLSLEWIFTSKCTAKHFFLYHSGWHFLLLQQIFLLAFNKNWLACPTSRFIRAFKVQWTWITLTTWTIIFYCKVKNILNSPRGKETISQETMT